MNPIRDLFDRHRRHFEKNGGLAVLHPFFEAMENVFFGSRELTGRAPFTRDNLTVQRYMMLVILAALPCLFFGMYNVGLQSFQVAGRPAEAWPMVWLGARTVMPLVIISYLFGFGWEILFAVVRKHAISEGVFVTAILFPLTLPPTTPWWQAAMGISFGVVIGKEVFGGTGRNFLNPALTGRAFLYFAYPVQMSGDAVWTALAHRGSAAVDAVSAATPLVVAGTAGHPTAVGQALGRAGYDWSTLFLGFYPDSIGASSTLLCLLAALALITLGVASYRIILGGVVGVLATGYLMNLFAGEGGPAMLGLNPWYHLLMGGAAFGIVFMCTDPVSAPHTQSARWLYGFCIGSLTVVIRVFNPAYPEGIMLAILFMNVFAALIDHVVVRWTVGRRIPNV